MNQRYQRACEIVGADDFADSARRYLEKRCPKVDEHGLWASGCFVVDLGDVEFSADTLTEALTEAVLAVEAESC